MNCCHNVAETEMYSSPQKVLEEGYKRVIDKKEVVAGSGTACILMVFTIHNGKVDKVTCQLTTTNLGDSGYIVIRKGKVVHKSEELQHYLYSIINNL